MVSLHIQTETRTGPKIQIYCPACDAQAVEATVSEAIEHTRLFYFIPLLKLRNTWVTCGKCGAKLTSSLAMDDLLVQQPGAVNDYIRFGASGLAKILAIVGLLVCWVPVGGMVVTGIALFLARGTKGWPKKLAMLGMIVGAAVTATIVLMKATGMKF